MKIEETESISKLEEDWDGHGAAKPNLKLLDEILSWLETCSGDLIPDIMPCVDGSFLMEFTNLDDEVILSVSVEENQIGLEVSAADTHYHFNIGRKSDHEYPNVH